MPNYEEWYANRAGAVAAATQSPVRQPSYGAASDLSTADLSPAQTEQLMNQLQTMRDEEVAAEEQRGFWGDLAASASGGSWLDQAAGWAAGKFADDDSDVGAALRGTADVAGTVGGGIADIPGVRPVGSFFANAARQAGEDLAWFNENVIDPGLAGIATPANVGNILDERSTSWPDRMGQLFSGETWTDAWERSQNTHFGRAISDAALIDDETRAEFHQAGFDEHGNPRNQAYAELRRDDPAYNLISGPIDFAVSWYAAPDVLAAGGVTRLRAITKLDMPRLTRSQQARVRHIAATPQQHLDTVRGQIRPWDVVGRRALAVREQTLGLRDRVRNGELNTLDVANLQAFNTSAQGPVAAHLFTEAARARQLDNTTGELLDEFDDDLFDTVNAALLGHAGAAARLSQRHDEVGDALNALTQVKDASLNQMTRWGDRVDEIAARSDLTANQKALLLVGPQRKADDAAEQTALAEDKLRRYGGFNDWLARAFDEGPVLSMAPRDARSFGQRLEGVTARTFRPTGTADSAASVISIPRAAWLKRPGIASLHSGEESFEASGRLLDQAAYYTKGEHLDEVAQAENFDDWATMRRDMLNQVAEAADDTQRARLMTRLENTAVEAVARRHGMNRGQARAVATHVRGMRANLIRDAEQQAAHPSYSRATIGGRKVDTYKQKNPDGTVEYVPLPVDVTQLRNTFVATDLRALDVVLRNHADSFKAALVGRPAARASEALEMFNHYWKPSVLFRLAYPVRNFVDDAARGAAANMSFGFLLGSGAAVGRGVANVPDRVHNRYARFRNWHVRNSDRYGRPPRSPQVLRESVGPIDVPDAERLRLIRKRQSTVTGHTRKMARAGARGGKLPPRPRILTKLDGALAGDGPRVIDDNGALRAAGDDVAAQRWDVAFDTTVRTVPDLTSERLHAYIDEHAEWLSNKGNGVMVERLDDGSTRLSVARRDAGVTDVPVWGRRELRQSGQRRVVAGGREFSGSMEEGVGDAFRGANSSEEFQRSMYRSQQINASQARADGLQRTLLAGEEGFEDAWVLAVNDHIRKSPVWMRMLDGRSDEQIVNWLRSREGRKATWRMRHKSHNPVAWVDELRAHLNHYLPDERLRAIARERDLTSEDVANLGRWDARPVSVDGPTLGRAGGQDTIGQWLDKFIDRAFNFLATAPTDTLVRNPFFDQNYRYSLRRWVDTLDDGAEITPKMRQLAEKQARQFALKQTKRYMFSLTDQSELTHMMRFMSPFMGAWQESMIRWARIGMERPEAFSRFYVHGWEGGIDDAWGLEETTDPLTGEPVVQVPMPESVKKLSGLLPGVDAEDLEGFEKFSISKESMNVSLQGDPWWLPSGGPLVQAPAAFFLRNSPELKDENALTEFAWRWMFPAGRPTGAVEAIAPSWVQQFRRYHAEGDDPVYNNMALLIHRNDLQAWRDAGRPAGQKPSLEESWDKAKGVQAYYTMSKIGSPFSFRLVPQSQMWIDKAREYREKHGDREGLTRFAAEMGEDAYLWWESLSKTNLNVPATSQGFEQYKRFQDQIEQYPELAPIITGMDAWADEFNPEVYQRQRELSVSSTDPRPQRGQQSGEQFIGEVETRQGWAEYRQWRNALEAELAARGVSNLNASAAEDLAQANRVFIDRLKDKLPGWGRDFEQFDTGKGYEFVDTLRNWVTSGAANVERPDIAGVAEYVELHDAFAAELDARAAVGGSRSVEANANADLAAAWDAATGELVQRNPSFADIYYRYLDRHALRNGSN